MSDPMETLAARTEMASGGLRVALRLEIWSYLGREVEARLRARPHFLARFHDGALATVRDLVDSRATACAEDLVGQVTDLRVYYGAETRTADEEDRGFASTVGEAATTVTRTLLSKFGFPGDDKPDAADATGLDLDATYDLSYAPSPTLVWAWRRVRALDEVRNRIVDAEGKPAPSFELRWHLPELVP